MIKKSMRTMLNQKENINTEIGIILKRSENSKVEKYN